MRENLLSFTTLFGFNLIVTGIHLYVEYFIVILHCFVAIDLASTTVPSRWLFLFLYFASCSMNDKILQLILIKCLNFYTETSACLKGFEMFLGEIQNRSIPSFKPNLKLMFYLFSPYTMDILTSRVTQRYLNARTSLIEYFPMSNVASHWVFFLINSGALLH